MQPNEKRFIKRSGTPEANVVPAFSRVKRFKRRWVLNIKYSVVPAIIYGPRYRGDEQFRRTQQDFWFLVTEIVIDTGKEIL